MPSISTRSADEHQISTGGKPRKILLRTSMAIANSLDWSLSSGFPCRARYSQFGTRDKSHFPFISFLVLNLNFRSGRANSSLYSPPLLEEDAPVMDLGFLGDFGKLSEDFGELNGIICGLLQDSGTENLGYECYQRCKENLNFTPQNQTLKLLTRYLIRIKDWSLTSSFCNDLKKFRVLPDKSLCIKLISACVKARKFNIVHSFLDVFLENDKGIALVGFDSAIKGFNQLHMYRNAVFLFEKMMTIGLDLSPSSCSHVMEAYMRMKQFEKAVAVFHEFRDSNMEGDHSKIYWILCECLGRMGRIDEALDSFREMLKKGGVENHRLYSSLISFYANAGEVDMTEELLREGESKKMLKDPDLFFKLIVKYVDLGMPERTLDVIATMKRVNIRVSDCIFCAVVNGFRSKKGLTAAVKVFEELILQGHEPGQVTYCSILGIYIKLGLYSKAESIFSEMEKRGFDKSVFSFSAMISAYAKTGRTGEAMRLVAKMKAQGCHPNIWTYNSLLELHCRVSNFKQLEKTMKEMKRKNINPNRVSYTTVISAYNRAKDYEMCVKYFEEFKMTGEKVDAGLAGILVTVFTKTSRVDELVELLQDMKRENTKMDSRLYRSAMNGLRDAGLVVEAKWIEQSFKKY